MFSRSGNNAYERLEGGAGPSRPNMKRLGWKKIAIGCAVLLGLVWYFGPSGDTLKAVVSAPSLDDVYPPQDYPAPTGSENVYPSQGEIPIDFDDQLVDDVSLSTPSLDADLSQSTPFLDVDVPSVSDEPTTLPLDAPDVSDEPTLPVDVPNASDKPTFPLDAPGTLDEPTLPAEDVAPPPSSTIDASHETDPDPLKTVHCTEPYESELPLVQYALMIDAGSTGSRIHIYKFNHCGASPAYEYEVFMQIQPGLSDRSHATPEDAAKSLDVLLDEAVRVVPTSLQGCTPIAVKATAGLRLLGADASAAIVEAVEARIKANYPFSFPDKDAVVIMDGKDEGVYAWITVNYLMGAIRAGGQIEGVPTYAVLDLGGGSTQIVFEPEKGGVDARTADEVLKDGDHKYALVFGGEERVLYQHSYLGYGLKSARESVHRVIEFMNGMRATRASGKGELPRIANPCLAQGTTKEVDVPMGEDTVRVVMAGEDVGNFEACNRVLELVMAKDAVCEVKPCSFDGVYQPSLLDAFPTGNILLLSYFYDRIMPLIPPPPNGGQPRITVSTIASLARQVCRGPTSWELYWGESPEIMEELADRPEWCLDLTFMHALLGLGYEFADVRDVELGKRIGGTELGWCLGATIAMVSGGEIKCTA